MHSNYNFLQLVFEKSIKKLLRNLEKPDPRRAFFLYFLYSLFRKNRLGYLLIVEKLVHLQHK